MKEGDIMDLWDRQREQARYGPEKNKKAASASQSMNEAPVKSSGRSSSGR